MTGRVVMVAGEPIDLARPQQTDLVEARRRDREVPRTFRTQLTPNSHATLIDSHAVLFYDEPRVSNQFQTMNTPGWSRKADAGYYNL